MTSRHNFSGDWHWMVVNPTTIRSRPTTTALYFRRRMKEPEKTISLSMLLGRTNYDENEAKTAKLNDIKDLLHQITQISILYKRLHFLNGKNGRFKLYFLYLLYINLSIYRFTNYQYYVFAFSRKEVNHIIYWIIGYVLFALPRKK
jgi:hypothetical protein